MKISLSFAKLLIELSRGNSIMKGSFKGKEKFLDKFIQDGVLDYQSVGTQQKRIFCVNKENLAAYLHHKFEIPSLEAYIDFLLKKETERSEAVKAASDSKIKNIKVFEGFLANTYLDIKGVLNGNEIDLKPAHGSFLFVNNFKEFKIPGDVTVVGVEGFENFKYIEREKYLFESIKPLFVWRYQNSNSISDWLNLIPNSYLHFGDFDPKGIHIYISEFRNKLPSDKCMFFIPSEIEELLIKHGEKKLFSSQMETLKNFDFENYPEISSLIKILTKHGKGLAQEVLIR